MTSRSCDLFAHLRACTPAQKWVKVELVVVTAIPPTFMAACRARRECRWEAQRIRHHPLSHRIPLPRILWRRLQDMPAHTHLGLMEALGHPTHRSRRRTREVRRDMPFRRQSVFCHHPRSAPCILHRQSRAHTHRATPSMMRRFDL